MSTVEIGRLTVEHLGRPIAVADRPLGVLVKVEHCADAMGRWTTVVAVTDGEPRRSSYEADKSVVVGGAS